MNNELLKNILKIGKKFLTILTIFLLITSIAGCTKKQDKQNTEKPKVKIINISKPTDPVFIETKGTLESISDLKNQNYNQILNLDKNFKEAQIKVEENQKTFNEKKLSYEDNISLTKISEDDILNSTIRSNENYLKNIDESLNFVNSIITKNETSNNFSNIFSVKDTSLRDKTKISYIQTKNQYELSNFKDINIENIDTKLNKTKTILVLTKNLLDTTLLALQSSISSSDFKEEDLKYLTYKTIFYKTQIEKDLLETQKNINEINDIIKNNEKSLEDEKNSLISADSELEKSKVSFSNEKQNKIFEDWYIKNNNNQFSKKITLSISPEYLNYLKTSEKIILNADIIGILHSINGINKENNKLEIEIYTYSKEIKTSIGDEVDIKMFIDKYIEENNLYVLPIESIGIENGKTTVKIVENNKIAIREVNYFQISNDKIVVTSGLLEGDQVVIKNQEPIKDGTNVEIEEY